MTPGWHSLIIALGGWKPLRTDLGHVDRSPRSPLKTAFRSAATPALLLLAACATAGTAGPREEEWFTYSARLYSGDTRPGANGVTVSEGDSYFGSFSVKARAVRPEELIDADVAFLVTPGMDSPPPRAAASRLVLAPRRTEASASLSLDGASRLLVGLLSLRLPPADNEPWFVATRPMADALHRRLRSDAGPGQRREVSLRIDLRREATTSAAWLCRLVPIELPRDTVREHCTFQAIIDTRDGWPIVANVTREAEGAGGASVLESFGFDRLRTASGEAMEPVT